MGRETSHKAIQAVRSVWILICTVLLCSPAVADIVYLNESFSKTTEVTQQPAGETQETIYLTTDGINSISGEIEFSISASRTLAGKSGRTRKLSASISLASGGFSTAGNILLPPGDVIDSNFDFSAFDDPLVDINYSDNKFDIIEETYSGFVPIRFSNEDGTSFRYGWAEIEASIELVNGSPDNMDYSKVVIEVKQLAYESNWDEPIAAGAVPEPAVVVLVVGTGICMLIGRRIFPDLGKGEMR